MTCEVSHLRLTDGHAWRNIVYDVRSDGIEPINAKIVPDDIDTTMSVEQIAKRYKVGNQTAYRWLVSIGAKKTLAEETYEMYVGGLSIQDIAKKLNVTENSIRSRLVRHCRLLGFQFYQKEIKKIAGGAKLREMPNDFCQYAVSESINKLMKRYKAKYDIIKRWLDEYRKMV